MSPFVEGRLAGYGIAIPVGAVAILIVNTSIRCGFAVGFMAGPGRPPPTCSTLLA